MKELTIKLNENQINILRQEFKTLRTAYSHYKYLYENNPKINHYRDNYYQALGWLQEFENVMNTLDVDTSELFSDIR